MRQRKARFWEVIDLDSGNTLASFDDEAQARMAFIQASQLDPNLSLVSFDRKGLALECLLPEDVS